MINKTIGKYKITKLIGKGGMATVYLAHDNKFDTNVAVKVLNKEFVNNENIRKRFLAEAKNMFRMSHPNIIKVTDLIDEGDTVAFVMEYIEGETLKEYLDRKGKLSDEEIKTIFTQMLEAVGYVHEQNLVHRDIKPSNFIITPKGQIKLLDFGIAKNTDSQSTDYTQTGTMQNMGTPMYMSPEQIKSSKDVTLQSDIYSLGVVLWQMVMGKKPYDTNTTSTFELQMKIVQDELPSTNKFWDAIIQKATAKDVLNRYETCLEIKKALSKVSEEEEKTILSNADEKTIVEPSIIFEKEAEVRKSKTLVESTESSKHHSKKTTNIKKYWLLFLVTVPILLFSIYKYPFKSEETSPEEITLPTEVPQEVEFPSVIIGNQEWMTENLNVETFRNGDSIPYVSNTYEWKRKLLNKEPACCYYENNPENFREYGVLYNWYAVNDSRGIAPEGLHIPSDKEWKVLINYLGGKNVAGGKMKSSSGWAFTAEGTNGNGSNICGFNGLPGGDYSGTFLNIGNCGSWWSSSEYDDDDAWGLYISIDDNKVYRYGLDKGSCFSVRCIRD